MINQPKVSIIVPCLNEQKRIKTLLLAIYAQTYPMEQMDVTIADGMSTDGTRAEIEKFTRDHEDLRVLVVDNVKISIPSALNRAIESSDGEIVLRLDAHSYPKTDYVEKCVEALIAGKGQNIGGIWVIKGDEESWVSRSIAYAAAHPLGVGDARYRHTNTAGEVDTVPFGCYYRSTLEKIGFYDESMLTNEDYELNTRIRESGGKIWLDPAIQSTYFSRGSFSKLAKQYYRYGFWKTQMLKKYPRTIVWRQALPPLLVLSFVIGAILALFIPVFRSLLGLELILYLLPQFFVSAKAAKDRKNGSLFIGVPVAISTMHLSWGTGFLVSLVGGKKG